MLRSERVIQRYPGLGVITWDRKEKIYCAWSNFEPIGEGGFESVIKAYIYLKQMRNRKFRKERNGINQAV